MTLETQLKAIREIDEQAADYIENTVLPRYKPDFVKSIIDRGGEIFDFFIWHLTPQKQPYWFDIWQRVQDGIKKL